MPATLPPGIGNDQQAQQATAFIREQPWYAQLLQSWGFPASAVQGDANGNPPKLSEAQQAQLLQTAQQHGIGISDRYHVDENGQIAAVPSHVWRNIGIGAAVAGLALTGLGAAGIGPLAGAFGGASGVADLGAVSGSEFGGAAASTLPTLGAVYSAAAPAAASAIPAAFGSTAVDTVGSAAPTTLGAAYGAPEAFGSQAVSPIVSGGSKALAGLSSPNIWSTILSNAFGFFGAKQSADASERAAQIQADSANKAAQLAYQANKDTLDLQKSQWDTTQQNMAPWLRTGQGAVTTLGRLMGINGAPTAPAGPGTLASAYSAAPAAPATPSYTKINWPDGHADSVPTNSLDQYKLLGAKVSA